MPIEIRHATAADVPAICKIQLELKRPQRSEYLATEYLIASSGPQTIGCAGIRLHEEGAYFYGLAVQRDWQRKGIGSQLMQARLHLARQAKLEYGVALAMFWNSRFFRKHGFSPLKRSLLPLSAQFHCDLSNFAYRRSAVMFQSLHDERAPQ